MSVELENLPPPTTPAATESGAETPSTPVTEDVGLKRGRTSELLSRANFNPPAPSQTQAETEAHTEDSAPQSLEATTVVQSATTPPAEDEVTRLRRENEDYTRRFQDIESARQAVQTQQLDRTQQAELQEYTQDKELAEAAYAQKYYQVQALETEYRQAQSERDFETLEALAPTLQASGLELQALYRSQVRAQRDLAAKNKEFETSYHTTREKAQTQAVEAVAKKYGLSMKDLQDTTPDLKVTEYFKVLDTTAKTIAASKDKEIASLKTQLKELETKLRSEFRDQFDNSPGAQPHRLNGGTAGAHVEGIKKGNSGKLLEKAFKNL